MKRNRYRKGFVLGIIILFFGASIISATSSNLLNKDECLNWRQSTRKSEPFSPFSIIPNIDLISRSGQYVQQTTDKGYIVTGFEGESISGNQNNYKVKTLLLKYDGNGNKEWRETYELIYNNTGYSVQQTKDQGYIIGGSISTSNKSYAMLLKINEQGKKEWMKTFEGGGFAQGTEVQQTNDNGYILTGSSRSFLNSSISAVLLLKTDVNGTEEWNKTFVFGNRSMGYSVQQTQDLGYIISGSVSSEGLNSSVLLIKTDNNGEKHWNIFFAFMDINEGYSVQQTEDLGFIIGGYAFDMGKLKNYALLIKTDEYGTKQWHKTFNNKFGFSVQQTNDKGYIICGMTQTIYNYYALLLKTDENGNEEWEKTYPGLGVAQGFKAKQTIDKGFILTGSTSRSIFSTEMFVLVLKTDEEGNMEWSSNRAKKNSTDRTIESIITWLLDRFPLLERLLNLI